MSPARTSEDLRAHNRARMLRAIHNDGVTATRSQLTRQLGMARGTASVLVAELTDARLLAETPSEQAARGRPTQIPGPHPEGPVALMVDLREDGWELAAGELGGRTRTLSTREHDIDPDRVFAGLSAEIDRQVDAYTGRVVGVGMSIAGPVRDGDLAHLAHLAWREMDVSRLLARQNLPVRLGNDATMAGLAEARRGKLRGIGTALHLHVDFGVGGCLVLDGRPLTGARGIAGEFGHMRLTGSDRPCMCGAIGCWGMEVGANPMLRHYGLTVDYHRGRTDTRALLAAAAAGDEAAGAALAATAAALGTGIGGLVNAHDPQIVTVSGLGTSLLTHAEATVEDSYLHALMNFHRACPPPIEAATLGPRGPLLGAMELVFDEFLTPSGLKSWRHAGVHPGA